MITSFIQGGLGNQMFQISAGISLAFDIQDDFCLIEGQHHLPLQGNNISKYKTNIFRKIKFLNEEHFYKLNIFVEPKFSYTPIPKNRNLLLQGYFQSEKYFSNNSQLILDLFSPTNQDIEQIKKQAPYIFSESCCSIHLRFGDYLKFPDIHPTVSSDYIFNALDYIKDYDRIVCFSDDPTKCKELFSKKNITYLNLEKDYLDMYAMSYCANNIIANSSFSWWGAWLSESKKVVAPAIWFGESPEMPKNWSDIYCDGWKII